jgi:4a-hydroxytetrahydrobiopterin dehydratase
MLAENNQFPEKIDDAKLDLDQIDQYKEEITSNWQVISHHHLVREFKFRDFKTALSFTNQVGKIAEEEKHHPDILLSYGKVHIKIYTHKINGLSLKDFKLAQKIDAEYATFK